MKHVWCAKCLKGEPPIIRKADHLVLARVSHYSARADKRVVGICGECLTNANELQKKTAEPVDGNHEHLVFSGI